MAAIKPATGCRIEDGNWLIKLKVQAGASRTLFAGPLGEQQKLCVKAAPVDGAANKAVIKFVAESFGVPPSAVMLERGHSSQLKTLRIITPQKIPPELCDE